MVVIKREVGTFQKRSTMVDKLEVLQRSKSKSKLFKKVGSSKFRSHTVGKGYRPTADFVNKYKRRGKKRYGT